MATCQYYSGIKIYQDSLRYFTVKYSIINTQKNFSSQVSFCHDVFLGSNFPHVQSAKNIKTLINCVFFDTVPSPALNILFSIEKLKYPALLPDSFLLKSSTSEVPQELFYSMSIGDSLILRVEIPGFCIRKSLVFI